MMDHPTKDDIPLDTEYVPDEDDIPLVAKRCDVPAEIARRALLATGGDIAWAVDLIENGEVPSEAKVDSPQSEEPS